MNDIETPAEPVKRQPGTHCPQCANADQLAINQTMRPATVTCHACGWQGYVTHLTDGHPQD